MWLNMINNTMKEKASSSFGDLLLLAFGFIYRELLAAFSSLILLGLWRDSPL